MRWFLYDNISRSQKAANLNLPRQAINLVRHLLNGMNPYVSAVRHALDQVDAESIPLVVERRSESVS